MLNTNLQRQLKQRPPDWLGTLWPHNMKRWVNGSHHVLWLDEEEMGGARCAGWGLQSGSKWNLWGIWGVWLWQQLLTDYIISHGNWEGLEGQSQPSYTVTSHARSSSWQTGHKKLCETLTSAGLENTGVKILQSSSTCSCHLIRREGARKR